MDEEIRTPKVHTERLQKKPIERRHTTKRVPATEPDATTLYRVLGKERYERAWTEVFAKQCVVVFFVVEMFPLYSMESIVDVRRNSGTWSWLFRSGGVRGATVRWNCEKYNATTGEVPTPSPMRAIFSIDSQL